MKKAFGGNGADCSCEGDGFWERLLGGGRGEGVRASVPIVAIQNSDLLKLFLRKFFQI